MALKNRKRLPDLKSGAPARSRPFWARRDSMPRISNYVNRHGSRRGNLIWSLVAGVLALLIVVIAAPFWLPAVRLVVPDRYIMAYAPQPVQQAIFSIDVSEQVPAPQGESGGSEALGLLESLPTPETPFPLPTPTPDAPGTVLPATPGGGRYVQPTPVPIEPTPTMTPAAAVPVDARAVDRENQADLSHADRLLTGFRFVQQTGVNNCGPAAFATMMSYWGHEVTLDEARQFLKPVPEDPNVRPDEMAAYAETFGYQMIIRHGGTFDMLKRFILAGYPVIIETGYDPEPDTIGWTSHYLTIVGYSEQDGGLIAMDTYRRPNWFYRYEEIDTLWRQFNRRYLVAYRPDQAVAVASIIGDQMNDEVMYTSAMHAAQAELSFDRRDPFAWFNLGTSLTGLGRYEEAASAYDEARRIGLPWRFLWYQFDPFEAYLAVGRYDDVITLADAVLQKIPTEEPFYYKGLALLAQGREEEARNQFNQALRYNRNFEAARIELAKLGTSGS